MYILLLSLVTSRPCKTIIFYHCFDMSFMYFQVNIPEHYCTKMFINQSTCLYKCFVHQYWNKTVLTQTDLPFP